MTWPEAPLTLTDYVFFALVAFWLFFLGACLGSFLNVLIYRLPRKISIVTPPSHCPNCKRPVRWRDNIPVFGWLVLRGRCRDCGVPISARYPMIEFLVGLVFLLIVGSVILLWR